MTTTNTKRETAAQLIAYAGYHDDKQTATGLYLSRRMSRSAFEAAFARGRRLRSMGATCGCDACRTASEAAR